MLAAVPGLTVIRSSHITVRQPIVYNPCIYIVAQGSKRAYLDTEIFTYDAQHYLVLTVPLPLQARVIVANKEQPYLAVRLDINLSELNQLLIEMGETSSSADKSSRGIFVSTINDDLADSMSRLINTLNNKQQSKILSPSIMKEILYHLLCGEQGHLMKSFAQNNRHGYQIANVIHYIQENYHESIGVANLASIANMSESSLHHYFKIVTHSSPIQYIKSIRLHQAKRIILDNALSIGDAAYRVGYTSPSQFSREYKRLFGVSPSEELKSSTP